MLEREKKEIVQKMNQAIQANDAEAFQGAFVELCDKIQEKVLEQAKGIVLEVDQKVLAERGVRQLTSEERTYYQKVIEAMKSQNPKQAVENLDVVMPETVIDQVFNDLSTNHPLLSKIQFTSAKGLTKIMMNTNGYQKAAWGKLYAEITKELTSGFKEVDVTQDKLSAFFPVCKAMLDLGPTWLDSYVRQVLYEALANGLEDGLINGTGKDMPVGMTKQVGDSVTITGGVYPNKEAVKITKFDNVQLGKMAAILSRNEKGQSRVVDSLILLVNPADYFAKVLPAIQYPAPGGGYVTALPFAMDIIQSPAVQVGKAVFGMAKLYFMGSGAENDGRILYSDDYHFLEDERVYLIKMYGHGFPVDNNAFIVFDISELKPAVYRVEQIQPDTANGVATLSDLKVGGYTLVPEFNSTTKDYTVPTSAASNTVTAVPTDAAAEIEMKFNDEVVANGSRITWKSDESNVVEITVTNGTSTDTYEITVTKE